MPSRPEHRKIAAALPLVPWISALAQQTAEEDHKTGLERHRRSGLEWHRRMELEQNRRTEL